MHFLEALLAIRNSQAARHLNSTYLPNQPTPDKYSHFSSTPKVNESNMTPSNAIVRFEENSHEAVYTKYESSANTAASKVLNNYEMLEKILSFLKFEDLTEAQKVNFTFNGIIRRSKKLHQTRFLEPEPYPAADRDVDPFHPEYFCPLPMYLDPETPHPLLQENRRFQALTWAPYTGEGPCFVPWECKMSWFRVKQLLQDRGQSWEMMFATQPPTPRVFVGMSEDLVLSSAWMQSTTVINQNGVRLGEIMDAIHSLLEHPRRKGFEAWMERDSWQGDTYFNVSLESVYGHEESAD